MKLIIAKILFKYLGFKRSKECTNINFVMMFFLFFCVCVNDFNDQKKYLDFQYHEWFKRIECNWFIQKVIFLNFLYLTVHEKTR